MSNSLAFSELVLLVAKSEFYKEILSFAHKSLRCPFHILYRRYLFSAAATYCYAIHVLGGNGDIHGLQPLLLSQSQETGIDSLVTFLYLWFSRCPDSTCQV